MRSIAAVLAAAALIGALAATAGILFIDAAAAIEWHRHGGFWLVLAPAGGGLVCALIARRLPGGVFLGLADMVLQAQRGDSNRWHHHFLSTAAAFIALVSGASVGQYGPVAHLGGALAAFYRSLAPRTAAACGIAAAIAAAFNAPITALVFVHEVVLRHYSLRAFTPVAVSSVVGYSVSVGVFGRPLFLELPLMTAALQPLMVLLLIVMGLAFGALATAYVRGIFWLAGASRRVTLLVRLPLAGFAAGVLAFYLPDIAGGGKTLLVQTVAGELPAASVALLFFAKAAATIICLGAGFAGGVVSPTLAIGALAGLLFFHATGWLLPVPPLPAAAMALCGMMALTAPVIGAPLAAILFTMELSGSYPIAIAAAVVIAVAVQVAAKLGGGSFYDMQLAKRGIDISLRRDEWQLATDPIAPLVQPAAAVAVVLPPDAALATAIENATTQQCGDIYLVDADGCYGGSLPLPVALKMQQAAAHSLQQAVEQSNVQMPVLSERDTLLTAMKKLENFVGESVAVVDGSGVLIGVISEGVLLRRYNQLVREYRREETAII